MINLPPWAKLDNAEKWKNALVIIPAIHVFGCFTYLFFFYYAFGHRLIYFASPTEVFSVSLAEVAPLYIISGIGLFIGVWSYETDAEIDERYSPKSGVLVKKLKWWNFKFIGISAVVLFVVGVVTSIVANYIFWHILTVPIALFTASLLGSYLAKNGFKQNAALVAWGVMYAFLSIATNGLSDGQSSARNEFSLFEDRPTCNDLVILKDVAENFLAADKNNNRVLIDDKC